MSDATQVPVDRIVQYTRRQIGGIWAAAALPVAALAWVVAPWLADQLDGPAALPRALLVTSPSAWCGSSCSFCCSSTASGARCAGRC
jgi:hypothetical protein